jgi:DNA-directed RNA polymerase subunit RPC12/RpoP
MAMVCTQCNTSHEQRLQCPTCGSRLIYRDQPRDRGRDSRPPGQWMQSFLGRLTVGLLLSQGLYFGLRHLVTGFYLATRGEEALEALLLTGDGRVMLEGLQLLPLLLGGMLAGAGQKRALLLGFVIGVLNSALCLAIAAALTHQPSSLSWYAQPLIHGLFGSLGAWVGCTIWKPLVASSLPTGDLVARKPAGPRGRSLLAGRIAWVRVCLGVLLAVLGSVWAEFLFQSLIRVGAGHLETASYEQDRIFTWEVRALAILFGGAFGGASTANGFKQGLTVGILASMILLLLPSTHVTVLVASLSTISTFSLSIAGGWFGSQLLPPIIPRPTKSKTLQLD